MTERLVEQQQCRSSGERAYERDPLLLPSGNFMRKSLLQPADAGQFDQTLNLFEVVRGALAEGDVLSNGLVWEKCVFLKHQSTIALLWWDKNGRAVQHFFVEHDLAGVRNLESGYDAEQRGFAAAAAADERDDLPSATVEADPVDCGGIGGGVLF